jgi:predicted Zn-dependent protease with MMP-like domain
MKREDFVNVAEKALDSLPEEFRSRMHATKTASAASREA